MEKPTLLWLQGISTQERNRIVTPYQLDGVTLRSSCVQNWRGSVEFLLVQAMHNGFLDTLPLYADRTCAGGWLFYTQEPLLGVRVCFIKLVGFPHDVRRASDTWNEKVHLVYFSVSELLFLFLTDLLLLQQDGAGMLRVFECLLTFSGFRHGQ